MVVADECRGGGDGGAVQQRFYENRERKGKLEKEKRKKRSPCGSAEVGT
jgi:hypothetical protein